MTTTAQSSGAVEATKDAKQDLARTENREDEHNESYKIHLEDFS